MKKLFKYEINESIAAKAAMNCVHKRLFKELYSFGSPTPQEEVVRGEYDPYEWEFDDYGNADKRQLIHQALVQAGLIQSEKEGWQFNNKIQQLLDKTNFSVSDAQSAAEFVKAYGQQIIGKTQEQEEDFDDPQSPASRERHAMMQKVTQCMAEVLEERGIDVGGDLDEIYFIISDIIERTGNVPQFVEDGGYYPWCEKYVFDVEDLIMRNQEQEELTVEQEEDGINKGGMHNLVQVGHIMNTPSMHDTYDSEWFSDLEEQEAYYENFRVIAELVADQIDRENGKAVENNMDTLFEIVKEVWKNNSDDLYIYDEVDEYECQEFFDKHYEEIKDEYMKREHNNIMGATHDDLFDGQ